MGFQPKEYKEQAADNRTTLSNCRNTMSAHSIGIPIGKYKKAHATVPAPIRPCSPVFGYCILAEGPYGTKRRVEWGRMSIFGRRCMGGTALHPGAEPARYLALKRGACKFNVEDLKTRRGREKKGGAQIGVRRSEPAIHKFSR